MRQPALIMTTLAVLLVSHPLFAQPAAPKELNNVEIQSKHPFAGTLVMRFEDGMLNYTFTEGRRAGAGGMNLDYTARKIGDELYLVGWHDELYSNHFVMVFDLKNRVDYTNAIMGYGTDTQQVFWTDSVIETVTPIE